MLKKALGWSLTLGVFGVVAFFALAWRPAIAPIAPPAPESFPPELVAKGEALSGAGFCAQWCAPLIGAHPTSSLLRLALGLN